MGISGGSSSWQRSCAYAQRGANRQPGGGLTRSGGRPGMTLRRVWLGSSIFGMLSNSASVYGIFMLAKSSPVGAFSTNLPPYMTAISSVRPATTPRSWVTRISDMLRSRRCSSRRSRICACTVTSRAVVGSSANSNVGPHDIANAIITRWRMPPLSSNEYWSRRRSGLGMRTSCSSFSGGRPCVGLRHAEVHAQTFADLLADAASPGSAMSSDPGRSSTSLCPRSTGAGAATC